MVRYKQRHKMTSSSGSPTPPCLFCLSREDITRDNYPDQSVKSQADEAYQLLVTFLGVTPDAGHGAFFRSLCSDQFLPLCKHCSILFREFSILTFRHRRSGTEESKITSTVQQIRLKISNSKNSNDISQLPEDGNVDNWDFYLWNNTLRLPTCSSPQVQNSSVPGPSSSNILKGPAGTSKNSLLTTSSSLTPYSDAVTISKLSNMKKTPPNHVKRPLNAFMIWAQIHRKRFSEENPNSDIRHSELSKLLGSKWKSLSSEEKQPYLDKAETLVVLHAQQYPDYKYKPVRRSGNKNNKVNSYRGTARHRSTEPSIQKSYNDSIIPEEEVCNNTSTEDSISSDDLPIRRSPSLTNTRTPAEFVSVNESKNPFNLLCDDQETTIQQFDGLHPPQAVRLREENTEILRILQLPNLKVVNHLPSEKALLNPPPSCTQVPISSNSGPSSSTIFKRPVSSAKNKLFNTSSSPTPNSDVTTVSKNARTKPSPNNHIKRPLNPFMVYAQIHRKKLSKENPNISHSELSKLLGRRWKSLSIEEKQPYLDESQNLVLLHSQQHPDYKYRPNRRSGNPSKKPRASQPSVRPTVFRSRLIVLKKKVARAKLFLKSEPPLVYEDTEPYIQNSGIFPPKQNVCNTGNENSLPSYRPIIIRNKRLTNTTTPAAFLSANIPITPFNLYCDVRQETIQKSHRLQPSQALRLLESIWKSLPDEKRQPFVEKAERLRVLRSNLQSNLNVQSQVAIITPTSSSTEPTDPFEKPISEWNNIHPEPEPIDDISGTEFTVKVEDVTEEVDLAIKTEDVMEGVTEVVDVTPDEPSNEPGPSQPKSVNKAKPNNEHIKRPLNPFMVYAQLRRREIMQNDQPFHHHSDVSRKLGNDWKLLSEEEKRPYYEESDRLRILHNQQYPDYKYKPKRNQPKKIFRWITKKQKV